MNSLLQLHVYIYIEREIERKQQSLLGFVLVFDKICLVLCVQFATICLFLLAHDAAALVDCQITLGETSGCFGNVALPDVALPRHCFLESEHFGASTQKMDGGTILGNFAKGIFRFEYTSLAAWTAFRSLRLLFLCCFPGHGGGGGGGGG